MYELDEFEIDKINMELLTIYYEENPDAIPTNYEFNNNNLKN